MRRYSEETGFTLAELMVVLAVLGVIIAATYAGLLVAQGGTNIATREAQLEQEIGSPLHTMDKWLSQNTTIEAGDAYSLRFRMPLDPVTYTYRRYVVSADTTGRLGYVAYSVDMNGVATQVGSGAWSTANANRTTSTPLFSFVNADGSASTPSSATAVIIEVRAEHDGRTLYGKRQVYFRNRRR